MVPNQPSRLQVYMNQGIADIGLAQNIEAIRAMAGKIGEDANQIVWPHYQKTVEELKPDEAIEMRDYLRSVVQEIEKKEKKAMTSTRPEMSSAVNQLDTEAASSNLYWTFGGKENREVFNVQTTVRGILTEAEIEAHIGTTMKMMAAIVRHGGHAKPVGHVAPAASTPAPTTNGNSKPSYTFTSKNGASYVKFAGPVLDEIECPVHSVSAKKKDTQWGAQWSHKSDDMERGWCNIRMSK